MLQAELRAERNIVLKMFSALLRKKVARDKVTFNQARGYGYVWLATQMRMKPGHCNISTFDIDQCYEAKSHLSKYVKVDIRQGSLL